MPRATGDLTRPLDRTVTPAEVAAIRRYVARRLRAVMLKAFGGYLSLAAIFTGAFGLDWLLGNDRSPRVALGVQGVIAGGFVLLLLLQSRRLRSLRGLATLPVHRVESPMEGPYARLFSPAAYKREWLVGDNYDLHPLKNHPGFLSNDFVWQLDVVRTHHGGPEQFFVLHAEAVRPAVERERTELNAYLWAIGVHTHPGD
jgi:hypothetical protein